MTPHNRRLIRLLHKLCTSNNYVEVDLLDLLNFSKIAYGNLTGEQFRVMLEVTGKAEMEDMLGTSSNIAS